jgi:hypothetical protein
MGYAYVMNNLILRAGRVVPGQLLTPATGSFRALA